MQFQRCAWLFIAAVFAALACAPAGAPASAPASTGQPKSGGVLSTSERANYTNLDPSTALRGEATFVTGRAYSSLLRFKAFEGMNQDDLTVEPALAERWEVSPDAKTYTFHLRPGVKFADMPPVNGRELTSADVKWSFEYVGRIGVWKDMKFPAANQIAFKLEGLQSVQTPDPKTAVVTFKDGFAPFFSYAATPDLGILPHEIYDQDGSFSDRTAGSGPWQYDAASSQKGTRLVWKKNPNYWDTGRPYVDELRTLTILDEAPKKAAFQTKQLDIMVDVDSPTDGEEARKTNPQANAFTFLGWNAFRPYFNVTKPPFDDIRFRRAFSLGTDREEFVRTFTGGQGRWAAAGASPNTFTVEELKQLIPYDPDQSRRLLQQGGYQPSYEVEYLYASGYGEQLLADSQLLQAQLKKVGINLNIKTVDRDDLSNRRRRGDFQVAPTGVGPALDPDVDYLVYGYFHPKSAVNYYRVDDPKLTDLVEATRRNPDPAKRNEALRSAVRYIAEQGFAWVYFSVGYEFSQPYVKGYYPNQANRGRPEATVWLDK